MTTAPGPADSVNRWTTKLRLPLAAVLALMGTVFGIAPSVQAAPETIFSDDFSGGSIGSTWTAVGDWDIVTDELGYPGPFAFGPNAWLGGNALQRDALSTAGYDAITLSFDYLIPAAE